MKFFFLLFCVFLDTQQMSQYNDIPLQNFVVVGPLTTKIQREWVDTALSPHKHKHLKKPNPIR